MAINTTCPECSAAYTLADQQRGKKVRCKHCSAVFVVAAASAKKNAAPAKEEVTERPTPRTRPSAVTARKGAPVKGRRDDDEDDPEIKKPRRAAEGRNAMPWIVGGGLAAITIVVAGIVTLVVLLREPSKTASNSDTPPAGAPAPMIPQPGMQPPVRPQIPNGASFNRNQPIDQPLVPEKVVQVDAPPPKSPPETKEVKPARSRDGRLTPEALESVKRATVYIRVTLPDGAVASGSGFFGSPEAPNIILTNAHVIGMKSPESFRPKRVQIFVNSGQSDEWSTDATVLGVDRNSDLAVLRLGATTKSMPKPLTVRSAKGLNLGDSLHVAGFPFGEMVGKAITINPTTVSSLRENQQNGQLERVQVAGGMAPGNSGGPVVNPDGEVVGVTVSGIPGFQINFAIPADRVMAILNGRPGDLSIHQPYYAPDKRTTVPVRVDVIDPRHRIKSMFLEVWAGNKPTSQAQSHRPPATSQPPKLPGDLPRERFQLRFDGTIYHGDVPLPDLPDKSKQIWWQQLMWVNEKNEKQWSAALELKLPSEPVTNEKATLALGRWGAGSLRKVRLTIDNEIRLSSYEEAGKFNIHTEVEFREKVLSSGSGGATVQLWYEQGKVRRTVARPKRGPQSDPVLNAIRELLPTMVMQMQFDPLGNIIAHPSLPLVRDRRIAGALERFHEPVKQALELMVVPLPKKPSVSRGDSWEADRPLPIDTPGKFESGTLKLNFIYLGTRMRNNRKEAVLDINGIILGNRETNEALGGQASGRAMVNAMTGEVTQAEITVVLDIKAKVQLAGDDEDEDKEPREMRVLDTIKVRYERK